MVLSLFPCEPLRYIFSYLCGRSRLGFFFFFKKQVLLRNFFCTFKKRKCYLGKSMQNLGTTPEFALCLCRIRPRNSFTWIFQGVFTALSPSCDFSLNINCRKNLLFWTLDKQTPGNSCCLKCCLWPVVTVRQVELHQGLVLTSHIGNESCSERTFWNFLTRGTLLRKTPSPQFHQWPKPLLASFKEAFNAESAGHLFQHVSVATSLPLTSKTRI